MGYFNYVPEKNILIDTVLKWIVDVVAVAMIALFLVIYMGDRTSIVGSSMMPALENSETVLIDRLSYRLVEPKRFDVVVFDSEELPEGSEYFVKRIIGLPGETIQIKNNKIYINDVELKEDYGYEDYIESGYAGEPILVGEDEYFVLGDNREMSEDSRFSYVGNISIKDIEGKAWFVAAPFNKLGFVD